MCRPLNPLFSKTGENKRLKFHTRVINLHFVSLKNTVSSARCSLSTKQWERGVHKHNKLIGAETLSCECLVLQFLWATRLGSTSVWKNTAALDYSDLQMGGTPLQKTCLTTLHPPPPAKPPSPQLHDVYLH